MQQQRTFEVAPRRGVLYDRNLRELAVTVSAGVGYAVPQSLAKTVDGSEYAGAGGALRSVRQLYE